MHTRVPAPTTTEKKRQNNAEGFTTPQFQDVLRSYLK